MPKRPTKDPKFIKLTEDININEFAKSIKGSFSDSEDPRHLASTKPVLVFDVTHSLRLSWRS